MAVSFTRFPWWLLRGKEKESVHDGSSLNSSSEWGLGVRDPEKTVKFPLVRGAKMASSPRKVKRKWHSREERKKIDREFDVVLVPSDGVGLSGSESDDSDWSIGWMEPHAADFLNGDEDGSFAVLVPCYRYDGEELMRPPDNQFLNAVHNLANDYSEREKFMDQWLSSLQSC